MIAKLHIKAGFLFQLQLFLALLSLQFLCEQADAVDERLYRPQKASEEVFRVRTHVGLKKIHLTAAGLRTVLSNKKQFLNNPALPFSGLTEIQIDPTGLKIRGQKKNLAVGARLELEAVHFQKGVRSLSSRLVLVRRDAGWDIIQSISMKDYLLGVLSKEVPLSWPDETLKAQALASKSYALAVQSERKNKDFDLEGSILDQHFDSEIFSERSLRARKVRSIIQEIESYQLKDSQNRPLKAFFHADCGGATVSADQVWGGGHATPNVSDPYCVQERAQSWTYAIAGDSSLQVMSKENQVSSTSFPRIKKVQFNGEIFGVNKFREVLGFERIKSSRFQVIQKENQILLQGRGLGHGVGLCQRGSFVMGRLGKTFREILTFYFPNARIVQ